MREKGKRGVGMERHGGGDYKSLFIRFFNYNRVFILVNLYSY